MEGVRSLVWGPTAEPKIDPTLKARLNRRLVTYLMAKYPKLRQMDVDGFMAYLQEKNLVSALVENPNSHIRNSVRQKIQTGHFGEVIETIEELLRDDPVFRDMVNGIPVRRLIPSNTETDFVGSKTFAKRVLEKK